MKNVHLISTIKPSKLIRDFNNKLLVNYNNVQNLRDEYDFQHLYITSDEVITEGDYIFSKKTNNLFKADDLEHLESHNMIEDFDKSFYINSKYAKKIILTTDVDLIKDGVQSIDNEFLEWFVKNPSCEEVKWSAYPISPNGNIVATNRPYPFEGLISNFKIEYKIIIPKEEPLTKLEIAKNIAAIGIGGEKAPKQETLEEAAEIDLTNLCYYDKRNPDCSVDDEDIECHKKSLLKKNKTCSCDNCFYGRSKLTEQLILQAERMYSKADKIMKFLDTEVELKLSDKKTIERIKWYFETYFKQFKKK